MENLESITKRIKSIKTTSKITFAMQMVATSKLQKFKKNYAVYEDYMKGFYDIFVNVINERNQRLEETNQLLFDYKKVVDNSKTMWIVIGSDLGMCGGYNHNIIKSMANKLKEDDEIYFFGSKIETLFKSQNPTIKVIENFKKIESDLTPQYIFTLVKRFLEYFKENNFSNLKLVYTHYVNSIIFEPTTTELLPLRKEQFKANKDNLNLDAGINLNEYEISLSASRLIEKIFPSYVGVSLYGSLLESKISEYSSRYNAMKTATDNAEELMETYQLNYNRIRQAIITQEITEIINGAKNK